ncbi:phBC6A51 family helix-turn-helix protein [uncultured Planococcus sp.]|uniref:phBC6A51 family helix-turn-helix protein n=1 Tax=uncultured Planococcus sp. TaxID=337815 RepID=UPI00262B6BDD|nr:phBC6A51 family helix-turn-helix protein [uncultured Planococcus sp.]
MAKRLSELQIAAIELLSRPKRDGKTFKQIAEEVGVVEKTIHLWRKDDRFNDELKREIVRKTLDRLPEIMESIPDHIINDGNAALFRTLLQAHSLLTDKVEVETKGDSVDIATIKAQIERMRTDRD